ncbi:hypothetical protein ABZ656_38715 [Streptomyces sp. NPDC007095]|uniref:hypothetical protein n=1 Tax=Streptomyces sp. NPDC007095 TaxID=3154482 RepID=UPI0033F046C8
MPRTLPHWPYATALDQALGDRGVPPGIVRLNLGGRPDELMRIRLEWDVSRFVGPGYSMPGGPVISLRRVYATPESVAAAADSLVHTGRPPAEVHEEEWPQAEAVRTAIDACHQRKPE